MIKHLLTITFRNLTRQKGRTLISVLCITAGLLCFSICHYYSTIMTRGNKFLETYERLAVVRGEDGPRYYVNFPMEKVMELGREEIQCTTKFNNTTYDVQMPSEAVYRISTTCCDSAYFMVFPPKLLEGSLKEFGKRPEMAVVTKEFIQKYADAGTGIGSSIRVKDKSYTIGGIIASYPAGMNNYPYTYDLFIPVELDWGTLVLLLGKPSDAEIVNKRIAQLDAEQYPQKARIYLQSEIPYHPGMELFISIIGLIILAVALTNYFSFSIGAFANRLRELSLRRCLGGKNAHSFGLLFCEQFIILILSCIFALALSESLLPAFIRTLDYELQRELAIDIPSLLHNEVLYSAGIVGLSIVLCYLATARISRNMQKNGLSGRNSKGKHLLRNISVCLQFFFSLIFLIGIMGIYLQMQGFSANSTPLLTEEEKENLIIISTRSHEDRLGKDLPQLCDYFRSGSWCESLSLFTFDDIIEIKGNRIALYRVTEGYLDQMKVEKKHKPGEKYAYITPEIDREIRADSSFQTIRVNDADYPIVGQSHVYQAGIYETVYKNYITILPLEETSTCDKIIIQLKRGADRKHALQDIKEKLSPYFPANAQYEVTTLYDEQVGGLSVLRNLFIVCAVISLLITVLGIYHSIQIDTERRQKEVAIRKVNGARIKDIYWLFGRNYVVLYLIAALPAVSLCLFLMIMADRMMKFDYSHPLLWILPLLVAALVIVLTIGWRIYRVARINPAEIIKNE